MRFDASSMDDHQPGAGWDAQVALQRLDGDVELLKDVVKLMLQTMGEHQHDLVVAAREGDFAGMRQHTHAMLASLKILGFDEQARIFEDFERAAVTGDKAICHRLEPVVLALWSGIVDELSAYQARQQASGAWS